MKLIITLQNMKEFRAFSEDIPEARILPYIQEAQQLDLKRLLGAPLYVDFLGKYDNSIDPMYSAYQDLLKGKNYTYGQTTVEHPGLIGYLSYCALARFYGNNQINITKFGMVQKMGDQSQALDAAAIASAVSELRANALALQHEIIQYLYTNGTTYPLYNYQDGSAMGQTGARFFDPDAPATAATNGRTLISW